MSASPTAAKQAPVSRGLLIALGGVAVLALVFVFVISPMLLDDGAPDRPVAPLIPAGSPATPAAPGTAGPAVQPVAPPAPVGVPRDPFQQLVSDQALASATDSTAATVALASTPTVSTVSTVSTAPGSSSSSAPRPVTTPRVSPTPTPVPSPAPAPTPAPAPPSRVLAAEVVLPFLPLGSDCEAPQVLRPTQVVIRDTAAVAVAVIPLGAGTATVDEVGGACRYPFVVTMPSGSAFSFQIDQEKPIPVADAQLWRSPVQAFGSYSDCAARGVTVCVEAARA